MSDDLPEHALRRLLAVAAEDDCGSDAPELPARYHVLRELGRGGMGVVYEAHDRQLDRVCAVKVLAGRHADDEHLRQRLVREALAAARLRHPHIAAVYDATPDYISMQRIDGVPLDALASCSPRDFVALVRDAARAVHDAHQHGVVHRDLKPSNLLVEGSHVYVVDFGLAKAIATDSTVSLPGVVLGTPVFMPPEQARGDNLAVGVRSDVYALGATLFHCLRGAPPFAAANLPELLRAVAEREAPPLGIERDLDLVVATCLRKEPEQRYATAAALADDLDRWLRHEPVAARPPSLGYRARKLLQRRGSLARAAAVAAVLAVAVTATVLVPIALRASAGRAAATSAVALSAHAAAVLHDATMLSHLGDVATAQRALDGAIGRARAFLAQNDVPRVHHLLSRLLRARGQPDAAFVELTAAIAGDPDLAEARFERGLALASRNDLDDAELAQAVADLSLPLASDAALTQLDRLLGRAERARLTGDLVTASEILREVLVYDPGHVRARLSLARIALQHGDDTMAAYWSSSAVDLQLGYGPTHFAREQGRLAISVHGLEGALVDFAGEASLGTDHSVALAQRALVHLRRTLRLERDGETAEALGALRAAVDDHDALLAMHPDVAGALNNRAVCLIELQRLCAAAGDGAAAGNAHLAAARDLRRAHALAPAQPEVWFNSGLLAARNARIQSAIGWAAGARARHRDAAAALRRALTLAPPDWPHRQAGAVLLSEVTAGDNGDR
ncbi:MAG: protein kinase [Planctomycetota bacterium]